MLYPLADRGAGPFNAPRLHVRSSTLLPSLFFLGLALTATPALAEPTPSGPKPQEPPDQGSVPRGPGGAILKPPAQNAEPTTSQASMPRPRTYVPPEYPIEAQKQGLEANVLLELIIDKDGKVKSAAVVDPAGHGFDEAAIEAAKKLEFEPARRPDGTPFAARIRYRYAFTLQTKEAPEEKGEKPSASEQKAKQSFRGTILTAEGEAPIAGATIVLTGASGSSQTEKASEEGAFSFSDLPPGPVKITIVAPGYEPLSIDETIAPGKALEVKYRLALVGGALEVVVRGARPPREVTKRTLEQREISRIPGTNGDALRSIQSLPGVARPPGLAGLLLVRGSGPQDTQTFIDGTPVPLIYHFGGLSSVVPTELLDKIDFYPGNFSTQYGRVQGGIVDAGIRSTKDDGKYHGLGQADLIDVRALLEGPVPFLKGVRFAAAGRRSYIDAWLGPALKAAGAGVTQAPVYYDYQFLLEGNPSPESRLRLAFFGSDDSLQILTSRPLSPNEPGLSGNLGFHTAFKRLQLRYSRDLPNGDRINLVTAIGQDNIDFGLGSLFFVLDSQNLTGRFEYTHKLWKGAQINAGLDMFVSNYAVRVRLPAPPRPGQPPNQPFSTRAAQEQSQEGVFYQPAAYVELELAPTPRAKIVPGTRVDYNNLNKRFDISPRVNARYDLQKEFPRTTAKGGIGFFQQPPQPQQTLRPLGNPALQSNRAIHYALGVEQELTRNIEASVEGFYKQLDNQVITTVSPTGAGIVYKNGGTGYVIGSEFLLKYKPDDKFFGWVAYTLSRSARKDGPEEPERLVSFDQTHILTILGSYRLGQGWEFGARFRLVSGNLVTPNVCNVSNPGCDPNRVSSLFHAPSGVYTPIPFSAPFSERLPLFHQLDVRVDKRWKFKTWQLSMYLDIQNVYNNANSEGIQYNYNYTARQYVSGLPILPSIGLRGEF